MHIHIKSPCVEFRFFQAIGTSLKGNNLLPNGAHSFIYEKSMEKDANDDDHCSFPFDVRNYVSVLTTAMIKNVRGAFGKFLAWSFISVTDIHTLSCLVSF